MIWVLLLKHIYRLSEEGVFERWVENPYYQYFTGEAFFRHDMRHECSGLSHWRGRIGDKLELLLAESLRVAHDVGALKTDDLARVTVETTVQPKNVTPPTDAKQFNPNLLLSPTALAQTRPQLEIYADDVKCTHGATVGQMDDEAIFYLRSRGLSKTVARNMLIHAVAGEVLSAIGIPQLRDALEAEVSATLDRLEN